ncbi:MAG: alkaline phosphatase family protein [Bryobacteraceae bacterium]
MAEAKRLVLLKLDGVPMGLMNRYLEERMPKSETGRAGKSRLPWIDEVFRKNGVIFDNFYVRGISLSAPSWSLLDTGAHLQIHGNVEYDRYSLRSRDYLNFFPFYFKYVRDRQVDMPGVEVLDEAHVPLLIDFFPYKERLQSFQLLQRGIRYTTLTEGLKKRFTSRSVQDLVDEWQTGFSVSVAVAEQVERDLLAALANPGVYYLDLFSGDFDHSAHLTADPVTQRHALERIDATIGRVWSAIQRSPYAGQTLFAVVSDHGMNSDPKVYSQGFNLVTLFNSRAAGGHHVLTNRHPLAEYKLRGLDPFVSKVVNPSADATYLGGQQNEYPTAVLDLDGNERAGIWLRSNDLNRLHVRLDQLNRGQPRGAARAALIDEFIAERNAWRDGVNLSTTQMERELEAVDWYTAEEEAAVETLRKKIKKIKSYERDEGSDKDERRILIRLDSWREDARLYREYLGTIRRLMNLGPDRLEPGKLVLTDLIPKLSMGDLNSIHDLQNYIVGANPDGSFREVNYFRLLTQQRVRNNVQKDVSAYPIDMIAVRAPAEALRAALPEAERPDRDAVWVYRDEEHQALLLSRTAQGRLYLRLLPVRRLTQDAGGTISFERAEWGPGFPLELFEDPQLAIAGDRATWLSAWHEERDWFRAVHRTHYSNGVIGLHEHFLRDPLPPFEENDIDLLKRITVRRSQLRETDMLVFAREHWNFNVRGFNPGGNHGSLFRISTHSVWMMAGPDLPHAVRIEEPYDSLSFLPTILRLIGKQPLRPLAGRPVDEILDGRWIKSN